MELSLRSDDPCTSYVGIKDGPILHCEKPAWHRRRGDRLHMCRVESDNGGKVVVTWEMDLQNAYLPLRGADKGVAGATAEGGDLSGLAGAGAA